MTSLKFLFSLKICLKLKFILFFRKKIEKDICQNKMKRYIGYVGKGNNL